ncbi:MAG: hypothetical protein ABSG18_08655 [Steroidobacteraceae bacterium]
MPNILDLRLLPQQVCRPTTQLIDRIGAAMVGAQADTDRKSTTHDSDDQTDRRRDDQGMLQIQLLDSACFAANEDDIHRDFRSNAGI